MNFWLEKLILLDKISWLYFCFPKSFHPLRRFEVSGAPHIFHLLRKRKVFYGCVYFVKLQNQSNFFALMKNMTGMVKSCLPFVTLLLTY